MADSDETDLTDVEYGAVTEAAQTFDDPSEQQIDVRASRWSKHGLDRLYLNGEVGYQQTSAHVDLQTGELVVEQQPVAIKEWSVELRADELVVEWRTNDSYRVVVEAFHTQPVSPEPRDVDLSEGVDVVTERHECEECGSEFGTGHGLAVHTGMMHTDDPDSDEHTSAETEPTPDHPVATDGGDGPEAGRYNWTLRDLSTIVGEFDDLTIAAALDWFLLDIHHEERVARWRGVSREDLSESVREAQNATGLNSPQDLDEDLFTVPAHRPEPTDGWASPPYQLEDGAKLSGALIGQPKHYVTWLATRADGEDAARQADRLGCSTSTVERLIEHADDRIGRTIADELRGDVPPVPDGAVTVQIDGPEALQTLPDARDCDQIDSVLEVSLGDIVAIDPATRVIKRKQERDKGTTLVERMKTDYEVHAAVSGDTNSRQPVPDYPHWWEDRDIGPTPRSVDFSLRGEWMDAKTGEWLDTDSCEVGQRLTRDETVGVVTEINVLEDETPRHYPADIGRWVVEVHLDVFGSGESSERLTTMRVGGADHVARVGHIAEVDGMEWGVGED